MALNGGNGLVYAGETLIAGEIRQPSIAVGLGTVTTSKTVSASAHAQDPSTPTELLASAAEDYSWLWVNMNSATGGNALQGSVLLEIWFGAASSEVLQATFQIGYRNSSSTVQATAISCPFEIPAGTRVSYTTRSARTGQTIALKWNFGYHSSPVNGSPITHTIDTSASKGIVPNNSTSANTWGSWTEIYSSTSVDLQGFHISLGLNNASTVTNSCVARIEIGIGAASSEVAIGKEWRFEISNTEVLWFNPGEGPYYVNHVVPAGSRVCVRWQHSVATAADIDVILSGISL